MKDIKQLFAPFKAEYNAPLSRLTTMKTGGNAGAVLHLFSLEQITEAINICEQNLINYYVLGFGSNILASDKGFDGVIIRLANAFCSVKIADETIIADSGVGLIKLSNIAKEQGLSGLEFASGIPGTLGGAVSMNAGAYGGEMGDIVQSVTVLEHGKHKKYDKNSCGFAYRTSRFDGQNFVITGAVLRLSRAAKTDIARQSEANNLRRTQSTPTGVPSAGSAFKRPKNDYAARLIENAGLKGHKIGGAAVSEKHAGFIINLGDATSKDVYNLIQFIQKIVYNKYGVQLEPEIKFLGDFS